MDRHNRTSNAPLDQSFKILGIEEMNCLDICESQQMGFLKGVHIHNLLYMVHIIMQ